MAHSGGSSVVKRKIDQIDQSESTDESTEDEEREVKKRRLCDWLTSLDAFVQMCIVSYLGTHEDPKTF